MRCLESGCWGLDFEEVVVVGIEDDAGMIVAMSE